MKALTHGVLILTVVSLAALGCGKKEGEEASTGPAPKFSEKGEKPAAEGAVPGAVQAAATPGQIVGVVVETMAGGGYTYVRVETSDGELWAAGPKVEIEVGDRVVMPDGMAMKNFTSDTLGRTFESILFVQSLQVAGGLRPKDPMDPAARQADLREAASKISFDGIEKADGGLTVAEVLAGGGDLVGKQITLRGKVVKVNRQIMERNWLHVQDGTGTETENDLTVTTQDDANAGDTILLVGTVARNSATFHGGPDKVVIEGAKVTIEAKAEKKEKADVPAPAEAAPAAAAPAEAAPAAAAAEAAPAAAAAAKPAE